jgi:DNA (cytosine-5)-methyltransferase 1
MVYYNEIDPYAAQWLRNLIAAGHIAKGEVDERSIQLVDSADLADFAQCHFFAGIGVWSHALRLAGWPDDKPVWTGSCPCQPFSAAGKRSGFDDERHLWPDFFRLIRERRPSVVFGEQVASKDGLEWLDLVQADLEGADYANAAADLCAAGVGAPHIRQRLYWVADAERRRCESGAIASGGSAAKFAAKNDLASGLADTNDPRLEGRSAMRQRADQCVVGPNGVANGLADASDERHERHSGDGREAQRRSEHADGVVGLANSDGRNAGTEGLQRSREQRQQSQDGGVSKLLAAGPTNGYWRDADWLFCRDGKWRPVEPGTFPLAHGAASRVGRLRAYGNAIVPQVAQTFIEAFMECRP